MKTPMPIDWNSNNIKDIQISNYPPKTIKETNTMKTQTKHTATPWILDDNYIHPKDKKITIAEVYNRSNYAPAGGYEIPSTEEGKLNARHIVKCVNSHDALVECLKNSLIQLKYTYKNAIELKQNTIEERNLVENFINKCEQALKQAEA